MEGSTGQFQFIDCSALAETENNLQDQNKSTIQAYSITKFEFEAIKEEVLETSEDMECYNFGDAVSKAEGVTICCDPLRTSPKPERKTEPLKADPEESETTQDKVDWSAEDPITDPLGTSPKPDYKTYPVKPEPEEYETVQAEGNWSSEDQFDPLRTSPKPSGEVDPLRTSLKPEGEVDPLKTNPEEYEPSQVEDSQKECRSKKTTHHNRHYNCKTCDKSFTQKVQRLTDERYLVMTRLWTSDEVGAEAGSVQVFIFPTEKYYETSVPPHNFQIIVS